jgi:hypothetical protein
MSRLLPAATLNDLPAASLNQPLGWKPIRASGSTPGFMNVHDRTGGADGLVYLANRFLAAGAGNWTLCLAHDGGARVFVDGKAVYTDPVRVNPAADRCARIPLHLSKGSHEIVVALDTDNGNGWGLFCRFEVPEKARAGKPLFPKRIG